MTKKECAIVMAHTGICMLTGDDFSIFHKYCEELLEHPIFTHQFPALENEIKEKSTNDFLELCKNAKESAGWIPITSRPMTKNEMANLIVEEKFINAKELKYRLTGNFREVHIEQLMAILDEMPAADIRENVHGEWIADSTGAEFCSVCGAYPYDDGEYHISGWRSDFCPNCGADLQTGSSPAD